MSMVVTDWTGFKTCDKCGAGENQPCVSLRESAPRAATQAHPGRPRDRALRRAIGRANTSRTRAFNRAIGLP